MPLADLGPGVMAGFTDASLDLAATGGMTALAAQLGHQVVLAQQVHGTTLTWVDQPPTGFVADAGPCDAMATRLTGVVLAVRTADCVPVLLADPAARLVAAIHAGWRGVFSQIVPRAVRQLNQMGAANLRAAIGPAICARCYAVSQDLAERFAEAGLPVSRTRDGEPSLNLVAGVTNQLQDNGVDCIAAVGHCTKCHPGYFSYRKQGQKAGRQCGWIWQEALWQGAKEPS